MFHPAQKLAPLIHIQGDFVTYGLGGFSSYPKGWGLDICYMNRRDVAWPFGRQRALRLIQEEAERTVKSGVATALFIPAFLRRLKHMAHYEWYHERCRILFEYAKASFPQFRRYTNFQMFANECIGAVYGRSPVELERIVWSKVHSYYTGNMEKVIAAQALANRRHAEDVIKRVFVEMLGVDQGLRLFQLALKSQGGRDLSLEPGHFARSFFLSEKFIQMLRSWHWEQIQHWVKPEVIASEIKHLQWPEYDPKVVATARSEALSALKTLPAELCTLLATLSLPIFIATDTCANFYRYFYGTIPMSVVKDQEEMQEYTVFGLCMYQPYYRGGVIVTHGGASPQKFWHTLAEEISHLTDGPLDRGHCRGHHRYSGSRAFAEALAADRAAIAPWSRGGALGVKEWGQALTLLKINRFTRARVMKRIVAYDAALDFDHYAPEERHAEIFAALPIVEKALGKSLARRVMPHLFDYMDHHFKPALKAEIRELQTASTATTSGT